MQDAQKPLTRFRVVSFLSIVFLLTAFVLVLLVALSLPIIKQIYIFELRSTAPPSPQTSLATELRFGLWGVCASSVSDQPTLTSSQGQCFGPMLGYQVPDSIASIAGLSPAILSTAESALLVVLVLHPISATLSFFCFVFSFFLASHAFSIFALIVTLVTAIVGSVALAIDLALVIIARNELAQLASLQFEFVIGNAVWMIVASMACTWFAVITLSARACFCFGVRRYPDGHHRHRRHRHHRHRSQNSAPVLPAPVSEK